MKKLNEKPKVKRKEFEIKLLSPSAVMPKKATRGAIGYDLIIPHDVRIPAHSRVAIPLDIAINLPYGVEAKIEPRSGCSLRGLEGYGTRIVTKRKFFGLIPTKEEKGGRMFFDADVMVGKIDPNYTDNINVLIKNNDVAFVLRAGSRIAQITFYSTTSPFFKIVDELTCKSRGGGLGHTGTMRIVETPATAEETSEQPTPPQTEEQNPIVDTDEEHDDENYGAHV